MNQKELNISLPEQLNIGAKDLTSETAEDWKVSVAFTGGPILKVRPSKLKNQGKRLFESKT